MKTVTLDVRAPAASMAEFAQAWKTGKVQKSPPLSDVKASFRSLAKN